MSNILPEFSYARERPPPPWANDGVTELMEINHCHGFESSQLEQPVLCDGTEGDRQLVFNAQSIT